jgi:hypothetical protein
VMSKWVVPHKFRQTILTVFNLDLILFCRLSTVGVKHYFDAKNKQIGKIPPKIHPSFPTNTFSTIRNYFNVMFDTAETC